MASGKRAPAREVANDQVEIIPISSVGGHPVVWAALWTTQAASPGRRTPDNAAAAIWSYYGSLRVRFVVPADAQATADGTSGEGSAPDSVPSEPNARSGEDGLPDVVADFIRGYTEAGGPPAHLGRFRDIVVPCESGWDPENDNGGGHRGLTQFSQGTWESMMTSGRFFPALDAPYIPSVFDPFLHGIAAARLALYVEETPGSTYLGQWSTWYGCAKIGFLD